MVRDMKYHTRLGSSIDQYPVGKEYPGYYDPENPKDVTETLKDITGGGSHFLSLICFVIWGSGDFAWTGESMVGYNITVKKF